MATRPEFETELFEKGVAMRRQVLGAAHVDRSIAAVDDYNVPLQKLVTEYCWGDIWNRPGLEKRTRSFLNLAMLIALNRPHEFRLHVRGALNNGITADEIREVIMQTAIYCGVPAALDAMRNATEVLKEEGAVPK